MARSRTGGRRGSAGASAPDVLAPGSGVGPAPAPSLASATLPRVWQGVGYRPLSDPAVARPLFDFAAVPWPERGRLAFAWGAFLAPSADGAHGGERLVGAVVAESAPGVLMLHGPLVVSGDDPLETAAQLLAAALDHAAATRVETVFARPQGLDRVWVRFGFIPVPEGTLPAPLAGWPGTGLYAWRGGSALWTLRETARD